jgi:hypothetical protein
MRLSYGVCALLLSVAAVTVGCGGSDGTATVTKRVGYFIDSAVDGVDYKCGEDSKVSHKTRNGGKFECLKTPVEFSIGAIKLGILKSYKDGAKIYPQDLVGEDGEKLDEEDITDIAVFLQSLDDDQNPKNGIVIDPSIGDKFDESVREKSMEELASIAGVSLVSEEEALSHLRESMQEGMQNQDENGGRDSDNGSSDNSDGSGNQVDINSFDARNIAGYTVFEEDSNNITPLTKNRIYIFEGDMKATLIETKDNGDKFVMVGTYKILDSIPGTKMIEIDLHREGSSEITAYNINLDDDLHIKENQFGLHIIKIVPNESNGVTIPTNNQKEDSDNALTVKSAEDLKGYEFISNKSVMNVGGYEAYFTVDIKFECNGSFTYKSGVSSSGGYSNIKEEKGSQIRIMSGSPNEIEMVTDNDGSEYLGLDENDQVVAGKTCVIFSDSGKGSSCPNGSYIEKIIKFKECN